MSEENKTIIHRLDNVCYRLDRIIKLLESIDREARGAELWQPVEEELTICSQLECRANEKAHCTLTGIIMDQFDGICPFVEGDSE